MIPDINDSDTEEIVYTRRKKTSHILSDDEEQQNGDLEKAVSERREQQEEISDKKAFDENLSPEDADSSDSIDVAKWKPLRRVRVAMADDDDDDDEEEEEKESNVYTEPLFIDNNFKSLNRKYNLELNTLGNETTNLASDLQKLTSNSEIEDKFIFHESDEENNAADQHRLTTETREPSENFTEETDQKCGEENFDDDNYNSVIEQLNMFESIRESGESQGEEGNIVHRRQKKSKNSVKSKNNHRTLKEIKSRKDEMLQIRSESQRYLRESVVKLPYYQPQPMTLAEFLDRKEKRKISLQNRPPRPLELLELEKPDPRDIVSKPDPRDIVSRVLFRDICNENPASESTKDHTESNKLKASNKEVEMDSVAEVLPCAVEQLQALDHSEISITNDPAIENSSMEKINEVSLVNIKVEDKVTAQTSASLDLSQIKARLKQMYGSHVPHLSGTPNSIIDFSEEQPIKKEVEHFIEKFVKHKEKTQKSSQELKNSKQQKLAFELKTESESISQAPGARLTHIKEQLKEKMEERKEEIRRKRMEAFNLENEEGFEGNDDAVDSEAELTDQTDTDEEEITDDEDAIDSEEEEELEFGHLKPEKKRKKSMFIDEEAEEDDADDEIDDDDEDDDDDLPPFRIGISPKKNSNTFGSINNNENAKGPLLSWLEGKKGFKDDISLPTIATQSEEKKCPEDDGCKLELECEEKTLLLIPESSGSPHRSFENTNTRNLQRDVKHPLFSCEENLPLLSPKSTQPLPPCLEDTNTNFGKLQENDGDSPNTNKKADSFMNGDSSFELGRSIIPGYQPGGGLKFGGHAESGSEDEEWFVSTTFKSQNIGSIENSEKCDESNLFMAPTIGSLHLKLEDSQPSSAIKSDNFLESGLSDLGGLSNTIAEEKNKHGIIPCGLQDIINDSSLSQKTDMIALCSGTFDSTIDVASQLKLENTQADSVNMNELLDLCSGKFNERTVEKNKHDAIPCSLQDMINDSSLSQKTDVIALCSGTFDSTIDEASQLKLENTQADSVNMNELLDLCSGKFDERTAEKNKHDTIPCDLQDMINDSSLSQKTNVIALCSGTFDNPNDGASQLKLESTQADSVNMNELLDLCSGKFNESQSLPTELDYHSDASVEIGYKKVQKTSQHLIEDSDSELDEKLHLSDSEEELENNEFQDEGKDESIVSKFKGFRSGGGGGIRKEFLDDEAELSGSGVSEDENEEDDDQLEDELNMFSDVDISDEELRNQVERVHNKAVLDEEKRELLLLQERYLMDGDLHSDGQGRQRKFRWRNIDENMDLDNGNISSEGEEKENEIEEWRLQRFEREKWLQEQEESGKNDLVSPKKGSTENNITAKHNSKIDNFFRRNSSMKLSSGKLLVKNQSSSFLAKGDAFLDRLAMNIKKEDESVGRRCTKNIIFKASSPEKVTKKRQNNMTPLSQNVSQNKRPKLNSPNNSETSQNRRRSIFDYFDTK